MTDKPISYMPTNGLSYDPEEPVYWDADALQGELTRVFEVCHGCRMCFKFCDSFPKLFDFVDGHDGDVKALSADETRQVMEDCFQCKLCEIQCPYTPRDEHDYQLDFPKLVHRYNAHRFKREGVSFRDRLLAQPDKAAKMARMSFGLANVMNKVSIHRLMMEKMLGIHRDKQLPDFVSEPFDRWAKRSGKLGSADSAEIALFQTCFVQNNQPDIGRDALEVFEANRVKVACVQGLQCCGMPAWEHGDLESLRRQARHNMDLLLPFVENGAKVVALNPTCSMMMMREYPELVAESDRDDARKLAESIMDPCGYLWTIRKEERFNTDFKSVPEGPIGYHIPCHLRAQAVGFKARDLLKKIPGVKPKLVMECCGHDGTYAMKKESFEASGRIGQKAFDGMNRVEGEVWATDCPLAAMQFAQHAGIAPLHPISILARAYRENGFSEGT